VAESRFLQSLDPEIRAFIEPELERLDLRRGDVLLTAGEFIDYVYFPTSCMASMVVTLKSGNTVEAATVGNDGYVGVSALLGMEKADVTAVTQIAGEALRVRIEVFRELLLNPRFRALADSFGAKILATIAQSAACMAFHPVQERLARWLLLVRDSTEMSEFNLTQDFIAVMLGVHRPTVTIAIRLLESAGLIEHQRGVIRIVDGPALVDAACECYHLSGWDRRDQQRA
jgi:CRP-like cAMP-binding protein